MASQFRCSACRGTISVANKADAPVRCPHCQESFEANPSEERVASERPLKPPGLARSYRVVGIPVFVGVLAGGLVVGACCLAYLVADEDENSQASDATAEFKRSSRLKGEPGADVADPGLMVPLEDLDKATRQSTARHNLGIAPFDLGTPLRPESAKPAGIAPLDLSPPNSAKATSASEPPEITLGPPTETEAELYRKALRNADAAMTTANFDQAIIWYQIAGKMRHTEEVLLGLDKAETGRTQALAKEEARRRRLERERNLNAYQRFMESGRAYLFLEEFDKSVNAFTQARQLFPGDVQATAGLALVDQSRARLKAKHERAAEMDKFTKDRRTQEKSQQETEEFKTALADGVAAMGRGQYRSALAAYERAKALRPGSDEAQTGWRLAKVGLDQQQEEERRREGDANRAAVNRKREQEEKERRNAYLTHLTDGNRALTQRRYDTAMHAFALALQLFPDDAEAQKLRHQAEKARDDQVVLQAKLDKQKVDELTRATQEAARKAEQVARDKLAREKQLEAERTVVRFQGLVVEGRVALAQGKFDLALEALARAGELQPSDPSLAPLVAQVRKGKAEREATEAQLRKFAEEAAQAKEAGARKQAEAQQQRLAKELALEESKRQARTHQQFVLDGLQALGGRQFDVALARFGAALQMQPGDKNVMELINKARQAKEEREAEVGAQRKQHDDAVATVTREKQRQAEELARLQANQEQQEAARRKARAFEKLVFDARLAVGKGQFDVALGLIQQAQTQEPGDKALPELAKQARQGKEQALAAKTLEDESALKEASRLAKRQLLADQSRQAQEQAQQLVQRFQQALTFAQEAARSGDHVAAIGAYTQALLLRPDNTAAKEGLRRAQLAREQAAATLQQQADILAKIQREQGARLADQKKAVNYESYMTYGRLAHDKSQWETAITAFNQALAERPGDADAQTALEKSRQARDRAAVVASAASSQALQQMRQREEEARVRQQALAAAKQKAQALAKQKEEQDAELLPQLLATARAALELKRPQLALPPLDAAAKLAPDNTTVSQYRRLAERITQAENEAAKEVATQELFHLMPLEAGEEKAVRAAKVAMRLDEGTRLLNAGQSAAAVREFEAVLEMSPGHPAALESLTKARAGTR